MTDKQFSNENKIFDQKLDEWSKQGHLGKFVVISEQKVLGIYDDASKAFSAGVEKFGVGNFFMKQILPADSVNVTFMGFAV